MAAGDWPAIGDADLRFHQLFVSGARDTRLDKVMSLLLHETRVCMANFEGRYRRPADLVAEHEGLIRALELQDEELLDHPSAAAHAGSGEAAHFVGLLR